MDGNFLKTREGLIEKLILFVIAAHEQAQILTARIEGPLMSEKAVQGIAGGRRENPVAQQRLGFFQGESHGKNRKRAKARKRKRASRDGATGAARQCIPVRETVRQRESGPARTKRP